MNHQNFIDRKENKKGDRAGVLTALRGHAFTNLRGICKHLWRLIWVHNNCKTYTFTTQNTELVFQTG